MRWRLFPQATSWSAHVSEVFLFASNERRKLQASLAEGGQHESQHALTVLVRSLRYEICSQEEASMRVLLSRTTTGFVLVVALCLALSPAVLYTNGDGPGGGGAPTFGQPTISGIQGVGFEQDLRLDPTNANRVYTSVPGALSSDTSWIWRSEDGGKTFKWVVAGIAKVGKPGVVSVPACAGGGDTELAVDTGGNLYFNDLTLANFSPYRSEDHGASFICSNTGVPDTAVDRQWYAVDGNPRTGDGLGTGAGPNIYLVNDQIGPGAVTCPVSSARNKLLPMV